MRDALRRKIAPVPEASLLSDVDCLTQIDRAFRTTLEAALDPDVVRNAYPEAVEARGLLSREIYAARCKRWISGTELIARHDAAAGREAARVARAGIAEQLAPALAAAPREAITRAAERCPSLRR